MVTFAFSRPGISYKMKIKFTTMRACPTSRQINCLSYYLHTQECTDHLLEACAVAIGPCLAAGTQRVFAWGGQRGERTRRDEEKVGMRSTRPRLRVGAGRSWRRYAAHKQRCLLLM